MNLKNPSKHNDFGIDLDFSIYVISSFLKRDFQDFAEEIDSILTTRLVNLTTLLHLCLDENGKKEYLKNQHSKQFNYLLNLKHPFNYFLISLDLLKSYYEEYIESNTENIIYDDLVENFVKDFKEKEGHLCYHFYEFFDFENEESRNTTKEVIISFFIIIRIKRLLQNPLLSSHDNEIKFKNFVIEYPKGTEKIVMLHKLGVLEFLRNKEPFNTTTNALASVVATITGIKQISVYPMLQTIFTPSNIQKNNPLNSIKTVTKVEQTLTSIGFKKE
jgi:hypothetical protein